MPGLRQIGLAVHEPLPVFRDYNLALTIRSAGCGMRMVECVALNSSLWPFNQKNISFIAGEVAASVALRAACLTARSYA
jgi:hypothetical protein